MVEAERDDGDGLEDRSSSASKDDECDRSERLDVDETTRCW